MDGRFLRRMVSMIGLVMSVAAGGVCAQPAEPPTVDPAAPNAPRLAVLPLANLTGRVEAVDVLLPGIYERIEAAGVTFLTAAELRPLLREYRIRGVGQIGAGGTALIRRETGVHYLLLGSLDIYDEMSVEVGISLRILNTRTMELVKATSVAAAGEQFTGLFDIGRVTQITEVAERVLDRAFAELGEPLLARQKLRPNDATRIAIVPFENLSEMPQANEIMSNILLSNLLADGYVCLEPGFVNEVFLLRRTMARGQIDLGTLRFLRDTFAIDYTITGVVDLLYPARGDLTEAIPSLSFGARLLEADSGTLRAAWEVRSKGSDGESFLGFGRVHALGQLADNAIGDLMLLLADEIDETPEDWDLGE